jgi:hypothetical protein
MCTYIYIPRGCRYAGLVCEVFRGLHPLYVLVCVCVHIYIPRGCRYTGPWIDWFVKRSGVYTLSIPSESARNLSRKLMQAHILKSALCSAFIY